MTCPRAIQPGLSVWRSKRQPFGTEPTFLIIRPRLPHPVAEEDSEPQQVNANYHLQKHDGVEASEQYSNVGISVAPGGVQGVYM